METPEQQELRVRIKEKKRELAKVQRERRMMERDNRLLLSVVDDIDRMEDMSIGELAGFRSKLKRVREIVVADEKASTTELEIVDSSLALASGIVELYNTLVTNSNKMMRDTKIRQKRQLAEHMEEAHKPEERLCANCHKRPRHFDDLCKRCANELGLRPTGKIGESDV